MNAHLHDTTHPKRFAALRTTFLAGLLVVVPISLTLFLTIWVFNVLTGVTPELLGRIPSPLMQDLLNNQFFALGIRVAGLALIITAIFVVGLITRNVLGRKLLGLMESLVLRLPMIRTVYSTIQQLGYAILRGGGTGMFRQVALIEYPRRGMFVIGFVTAPAPEECNQLAEEPLTSVFIPTTPNPTSGFLLYVPSKDVRVLSMSVLEGMRLVISGGVVKPRAPAMPEQTNSGPPAAIEAERPTGETP